MSQDSLLGHRRLRVAVPLTGRDPEEEHRHFERPDDRLRSSPSRSFVSAYLHLFVFASVAARGGGLALTIEAVAADVAVGHVTGGAAVAVALVVYLLSLWVLEIHADDPPLRRFGVPVAAVLVLGAAFMPAPVLSIGLLAAGLVTLKTPAGLRMAG